MPYPALPRHAAPPSLRKQLGAGVDPRAAEPPGHRHSVRGPNRHPLAVLAAFASSGAAIVHFAVVPEHDDWAPSAAFFGALAAYQLTWAVILLLRPVHAAHLWSGLLVNAAALVTWLGSRLAGLPFGPHKGEPEPFARTDVLAAVLQVAIVAAVLWTLTPRPVPSPARPRLAIGGAAAGVAAISVLALSGAAGHAHAPTEGHLGGHMDGGTHSHPAGTGQNPDPTPATVKAPNATGRPAKVAPTVDQLTRAGKPAARKTPASTGPRRLKAVPQPSAREKAVPQPAAEPVNLSGTVCSGIR